LGEVLQAAKQRFSPFQKFATRHRNELKYAGAVVGHSNYATTTANVYAQSVEASVIAVLEEDERRIAYLVTTNAYMTD